MKIQMENLFLKKLRNICEIKKSDIDELNFIRFEGIPGRYLIPKDSMISINGYMASIGESYVRPLEDHSDEDGAVSVDIYNKNPDVVSFINRPMIFPYRFKGEYSEFLQNMYTLLQCSTHIQFCINTSSMSMVGIEVNYIYESEHGDLNHDSFIIEDDDAYEYIQKFFNDMRKESGT